MLRSLLRVLSLALPGSLLLAAAPPLPLEESVVTEVVNDVQRIAMPAQRAEPAIVRSVLHAPDRLRTGRASRAELEAADGTITRLGANTLFAFDRARRELRLERGSVLFHAPTGRGGGTIRSPSASASVLGTTIIASATPDGGFKLLVLEGRAQVELPAAAPLQLAAGQMTFVRPGPGGAGAPGPVIHFDLERQVRGSQLVNGFARPLPSQKKVDRAAAAQRRAVGEGRFVTTGFLVFTATSDQQVNGIETAGPDADDFLTGPFTGAQRLALNTPLVLTSSALPEARLFRTPLLVPVAESAFLNQESDTLVTGLLAHTLRFDTPSVDFSGWNGPPEFNFIAREAITLTGDLTLQNTGGLDSIRFFSPAIVWPANATLTLPAGTTGTPLFYVDTDLTLSLTGGGITNAAGGLLLQTHAGDLRLASTQLSAGAAIGGSTVVPSAINLEAPRGAIQITGSTFAAAGSRLAALARTIQLSTSTIHSTDGVWLDATDDITLDQLTLTTTAPTTATFQAAGNGLLDTRAVRFDAFKEINLGARTIALQDVHFGAGSVVRLVSEQGQLAPRPNTGAAVQTGYVNFVRDVTYAGEPAQNFVAPAAGGTGTQPPAIILSKPSS